MSEYAKSVGAVTFDTSAATNRGIDEVFAHVAKSVAERHARLASAKKGAGGVGGSKEGGRGGKGGTVNIGLDGRRAGGGGGKGGAKGGCC